MQMPDEEASAWQTGDPDAFHLVFPPSLSYVPLMAKRRREKHPGKGLVTCPQDARGQEGRKLASNFPETSVL